MSLSKDQQYVYRIGSDNQYRFFWREGRWRYEFLAGGVLFDEQFFDSEQQLVEGLASHGMQIDQFAVDHERAAENYSAVIREKIAKLEELGIAPCPKHGLSAKNLDGTCQACVDPDFFDDMKGTEG